MRIDLHTHSAVSDGTDAPGDLVRLAERAGLDVVALTDHDTAAGWAEATEAAREVGITLVPGMEISTRHDGRSVHLLAYLPDPAWPPLAEELQAVLGGRDDRVPLICAQLTAHGVEITEEEVRAAAGDSEAAGRPHVADALVARGVVHSREEAFALWLEPGRPGHVHRYAPDVADAVDLVAAAGGASVLAHPWGRHGRSSMGPATIEALASRGLAGLEVDHQDHEASEREELRAIARGLDLVVTGSSDYHGTGKVDHDLGCHLTDPADYERLLDRAAAAATAAGRDVPPVVSGS